MLKAAKFNDAKTHRYYLSRLWEPKHSKLLFIGLNPSKADDVDNDPTVTRLVNFSKSWGFGGFYITNLYSFISPDPDEMIKWYYSRTSKMQRALYKENMEYALRYARLCSMVVFCWGASNPQQEIANKYIRTFRQAYCFGVTKEGHPKHPLYLASNTQLVKYLV